MPSQCVNWPPVMLSPSMLATELLGTSSPHAARANVTTKKAPSAWSERILLLTTRAILAKADAPQGQLARVHTSFICSRRSLVVHLGRFARDREQHVRRTDDRGKALLRIVGNPHG